MAATSYMMVSSFYILPWCYAELSAKGCSEMALGAETAAVSDLCQAVFPVLQQLASQLQPLSDHVLPNGHAGYG